MSYDTMGKYLNYIHADSNYYKRRSAVSQKQLEVEGLTEDWKITDDETWRFYNNKKRRLMEQGWKIHISSRYEDIEEILKVVADILIPMEISFKHLKSKEIVYTCYSKNANRLVAGKFITIYPDDDQFLPLLDTLYIQLKKFKDGPYILTDKQWKDSNIYYRYGAFVKMLSDKNELCIKDPSGKLIPDVRGASYYLPEFIVEPEELKRAEKMFNPPAQKENKLAAYDIGKTIRYSNAGGIYLARRKDTKKQYIIKEARNAVGLDSQYKTALDRLENENHFLDATAQIKGVVKKVDFFKIWKHTFLVEEYVEGDSLTQWIARNYPFTKKDDVDLYFSNSLKIMNDIKETIIKMHDAGVSMCDLQPHNILIDDQYNIKIIDLETAADAEAEQESSMATKGYYDKRNRIGKEKDWYSLNRIFQYMLLPIGAVYDFDMKINTVHCRWIREQFGTVNFEKFLIFQKETLKNISKSKEIFGATYDDCVVDGAADMALEEVKGKLLKGLVCNCADTSESLINGDIRQFELNCGMFNLLTGGFGAIAVLNKYNYTSPVIEQWIEKTLPIVMEGNYNPGLLTGRTGIACTLFESGYINEAEMMMELVMNTYDASMQDLSLRSGISGLGLALVAFYKATGHKAYLQEAERIAAIIEKRIKEKAALVTSDWESSETGLVDGYSGMSLMFSALYGCTKKTQYYGFSKELIFMDLDKSFHSDRDGSLQTLNTDKLLPYLRSGSIGIGVAIKVLNTVGGEEIYAEELEAIVKVADYRCCYEAGFFDGIGGFFLCQCIDCKRNDYMEKAFGKLKLFLVSEEDKLFLPAKYFYKLSMDMYSGSVGILAAIYSAEKRNPLGWLPLIENL